MTAAPAAGPALGVRANWRQFGLLVAINGLVGAMVGLERTILPLLAEAEFGLTSHRAMLSFIAAFGLAKAVTNGVTGPLVDRHGRRPVLITGWMLALPVPVMVMLAPTWGWVVAANLLLGVSQGLTWSTTVIMKIDLAGPARRGLALGLNEFAGYVAVAGAAYLTGVIAAHAELRPEPFYLGVAVAALGLGLSATLVRDTLPHVRLETATSPAAPPPRPSLFDLHQAGLVNNLNDGVVWGLFPVLLASAGLGLGQVGAIAAAYPLTWGLAQLGTGALSDRWGRSGLIVGGMLVQGAALFAVARWSGTGIWLGSSVALGLGTAMVYPTLLAAIGDRVHPGERARAVGRYRFWRDLGYVVGALGAGWVSDRAGVPAAVMAAGVLTMISGVIVAPGRYGANGASAVAP